MKINVKKLYEDVELPVRTSSGAAGYDIHAHISEAININPHCTEIIGTGLAFEIPNGYFGGIFARSGISSKLGIRPAYCTGVYDSDYRGELLLAMHNDTDKVQTIYPNQRIAQLVILSCFEIEFNEVENLSETDRGNNGFGSTDK